LASRWNILTTGERYKEEKGAPPRLVNTDSKNLHESNHVKILESGLMVTIKTLIDMGKKVVIIGPVPEIGHDVPSAYRISMLTGRDVNYVIAPTIDEYRLRSKDVLDIFKRINNKHETTFVRPDIYLCNKEICKVAVDDDVLYRDDDHLSTYGSEYISRAYDSIFHNLELDKP